MEDNSELHPGSLLSQCKKAIEVIDKENDAYEELISKLRTNIVENDTMSGKTADSIKAYVAELIYVIEYAIKANEIDKSDHQVLLEKVNSVLADKVDVNEVLCGYEIHNNISIVENRIESYRAMSETLSKECAEAIIDSLYMIKQEEYEDQIADLERELEDLRFKEERFNTIDVETINLFSKSSEIRKMASLKLEDMWGLSNDAEDSPYILGKLKTAFNIFNSGDVIPDSNDDSEESDDKVYEYVLKTFSEYFTKEQITFLYRNKRSLFNELYAVGHWNASNCDELILTIRRMLKDNGYILFYSNEILEKNILDAFGWNYSEQEIKELNYILEDFGIVNKYSIFCFLMCCHHESSDDNQYMGLEDYYYDNHGILYSENNLNPSYGKNGRGIGYIQVTYEDKHKEAYDFLLKYGYIKDDDPVKSAEDGYVSALAQNPWAVSAWYWACLEKVKYNKKLTIPLNEYVISVIESDDYKYFSVGLPYVCEAFVYGVADGGEIDTKHHLIARGDENWDVNIETEKVEYDEGDNDFIFDSIERYEDFKNTFNDIKDYIK